MQIVLHKHALAANTSQARFAGQVPHDGSEENLGAAEMQDPGSGHRRRRAVPMDPEGFDRQ